VRLWQEQSVVHSDFCCCNILFRIEQKCWSIKVANAGVLPAVSSLVSRRVFLAPELLVPLNLHSHLPESRSSSATSLHSPFDPTDPEWKSPFTKESDVFALGITFLQLFRHSLFDCKDVICSAVENQTRIEIPIFPDQSMSLSFPRWLASIQSIILACTAYHPKDRPSACEIRFGSFFVFK
jgi:serine/threonine protein kinase